MIIGRDLVRALQEVARYMPLREAYDAIAMHPAGGAGTPGPTGTS